MARMIRERVMLIAAHALPAQHMTPDTKSSNYWPRMSLKIIPNWPRERKRTGGLHLTARGAVVRGRRRAAISLRKLC